MQGPRATIPQLAELSLVVETSRLKLRPFTEADVDTLFPLVSQPELPKMMSWNPHASREETLAFVREHAIGGIARNEDLVWAIEHESKLAGCIELGSISWHHVALRVDRAELGYWLAPALWKQGLMTEAASAAVRFGFEKLSLHKITTRCFVDNHASRRVIEKTGFRFVGRAEDDVWKDGRWITHLLYEMTSPEWPDVHTTMKISRPRPT
jgi:ribosomal-protein-alanine N-acetyltransferase